MQHVDIIEDAIDTPTFEDGAKLTAEQKLQLWTLVLADPTAPSRAILERAFSANITIRHLNRLRREWGLNRLKGRPRKPTTDTQAPLLPCPVRQEPNLPFIGVHIFSRWVETQGDFPMVLDLIKQAIDVYMEKHPEASFPLLVHNDDTLLCRFKALFYAPLFGIGKLIEYDVKEHALESVIGRSYQSSTLNQYLAQLEWIDATPTLMNALATIDPDNSVCFIDGHMIPFWSRVPMHKGKITMLGRIMAGSQAVVAHTDDGRAVFFDYQPPDVRLSRIIVDYCAQVVEQTGIRIFVIDREVNSEAMATAFAQRGWGLLSMLDKNEYTDLSDWDAEYVGQLDDGAEVYAGGWAEDKKNKADDPRTFVLVVREGRILPYWGTPAVADQVAYIDWPRLYSQRTEIQENNFKRMKDHGALDVNFGIKKIVSEDRHHQRKLDQKQEKLEKSGERVSRKKEQIEKQEAKVRESEIKGHGKRLEQRRNRLAVLNDDYAKAESKHKKIEEDIDKLGPAGERADRDFRKQSIMTLRTLLLENALIAFMTLLMAHVAGSLSMNLDSLIKLLFERSGGLFETPSELVYLVNMKGLSKTNKRIMLELIKGLNKMGLEKDGKPVSVRARGDPNP